MPTTPRLLRLSLGLLLSAAPLTATGPAPAAGQQPTFKTATKTVPVYTTVLETDGRLVADLRREDFEILDNGKPQDITVFASEAQPITLVLLLDRSASMERNYELARAAAERLVTQLAPDDKARIGSFSTSVQIDPDDFTSDHGELIEVLRTRMQQGGPTPLWDAIDDGITALGSQLGRRVVLVLTDGADAPDYRTSRFTSLKHVMDRARRDDVMIYAVGLKGRALVAPGGGRFGGGFMKPMELEQDPDPGLVKIAAETGGGYFELKSADNLAATFERVAEELRRQYALGFSPEKLDSKTHKLDVRVKRSGLIARARKSYLAAGDEKPGK